MPSKPMTKKKARLHGFLSRYIAKHSFSPSLADMGRYMGVTRTPIYVMLKSMAAAGWVSIEYGKARGVTPK